MRTLFLFLSWCHFAAAEVASSLDQVVNRIEALSCDVALGRTTMPVANPVVAAQFAAQLMSGVAADAVPEDVGPQFVASFERFLGAHPLPEPPFVDGRYPHVNALERLDERVRAMTSGLRSRRQASAVAFAVAGVFADIVNDVGDRRAAAQREIEATADRYAAASGEPLLLRALEALGERLDQRFSDHLGEVVPPKVRARLNETSIRAFLARELILMNDLLDHPERPREPYLTVPPGIPPEHALAARLRNDFRLIGLVDGPHRHGGDFQQLRQAIDRLGPELEVSMPPDTFHAFTLPTNEMIMTDAIASPRLRQLLLNRLPAASLLPPLAAEGPRRARRDGAPPARAARPIDPRAPRLAGLKWYVTHVRPELVWKSAEIEDARVEADRWRLSLSAEQTEAACREIRAGAFEWFGYWAWAEAAEACVRLPAPPPAPVEPPPGPSVAVKAARAVAPHAIAVALSLFSPR